MKELQVLKEYQEEQRKEMEKYIIDINDMLEGKGRHEDHTKEKIGRCTYCSCGVRVQTG